MPLSVLNLILASHYATFPVILCFIPLPQIAVDYQCMTDGFLNVSLYPPTPT